MGESDPACSAVTATREVNSPPGKKRALQTRPGRLTFVDSIKEGFRKISIYNSSAKKKDNALKRPAAVVSPDRRRAVIGIKRKKPLPTTEVVQPPRNFELYLSSLPKCNTVDRTVGWVYKQPVEWNEDPVSLTTLPQRGRIVPLPQPPMTRTSTVGYETSVSHYESERGTHGRGTPPPLDVGQRRLDDLFRQLHVRQEHHARKEMARHGELHLSSRNLKDVESSQVLGYPVGVTPELLPFIAAPTTYKAEPPTIKHKNSFFYNRAGLARQDTLVYKLRCDWGSCPVRVTSHQELFEHVQHEHISMLPAYNSKYTLHSLRSHQLICRWRDCFEVFDARYKLFLHIQKSHFKFKGNKMEIEEFRSLEDKYATHPLRKVPPSNTRRYPHEHSSLHVTSIPFPEAGRETLKSTQRYSEALYKERLHSHNKHGPPR